MTLASLFVSGLALVVSFATAVAQYRQSGRSDDIQERLAGVEEARRFDELRPTLTMSSRVENDTVILELRNDDRTDLDSVEILEAVEVPTMLTFGINQVLNRYRALKIGEALTITCARDPSGGGGRLVLNVRVTKADLTWRLAPSCQVQPPNVPMGAWV